MKIAKAWEEEGVRVPKPFARTIKVLFAPDRQGVDELTFTIALIEPDGQTDLHSHDRPELIYVVSGIGVSACNGETSEVRDDTVLLVEAGEKHQIRNSGRGILKLATVFVPGYTAKRLVAGIMSAAEAAQG